MKSMYDAHSLYDAHLLDLGVILNYPSVLCLLFEVEGTGPMPIN